MGKIQEKSFFLHTFFQKKFEGSKFFNIPPCFSIILKCLMFLLHQEGGSPGKFSFSTIGGVKNCLREGDCVLEGQPMGIPPPRPPCPPMGTCPLLLAPLLLLLLGYCFASIRAVFCTLVLPLFPFYPPLPFLHYAWATSSSLLPSDQGSGGLLLLLVQPNTNSIGTEAAEGGGIVQGRSGR